MADNKKEIERAELHRTIWAIADEMRGSVDGWDFKSYILGMLFYRYISENITSYINSSEKEAGSEDFSYADMPDSNAELAREDLIKVKGFFILPSQLFENVCKVCDSDPNLNMTLEGIFASIENSAKGTESEDDFKGLFADLDVNSNKLGATVIKRNEKLVKLLRGVQSMKLGDYQNNTIDAFGDAYEYLMGMYASNAGKSGGEYYTPQEVSELLTKLATVGKTQINKVYDPACGSGSLLLKAAKILGKDNVRQGFYGQEINLTTYNLCRINMFLHDIDYDKFDIAKDFWSYYNGYDAENGKHCYGYKELVEQIQEEFPEGEPIVGEEAEKRFIGLYGSLLKSINILSTFDQFEGKEILSDRQLQDYQSNYLDLQEKWRKRKKGDKEDINDDLVFETELIRQVEINIDYILMLVQKYHDSNCTNKEILVNITKAIGSSLQLRSKKELIESFINSVNAGTDVEQSWRDFVQHQKEEDLKELIESENLKPEETAKFIESSFRDGQVRTTGTDIDKILPPMSRFGGGNRQEKKKSVIEKLQTFFERYFGL